MMTAAKGRSSIPGMEIVYKGIDDLIPYARNARTHSDAQVGQIAESIKEFGWTNPVLIDGAGGIIAGHGRVLAARRLGMSKVPVIELAHLTDQQKRAYILADNKLAENAGWDQSLLRLELGDLAEEGVDLSLIGFSGDEIDKLFADSGGPVVSEVEVSDVHDRFWISVRGPLASQSEALARLKELMADLDGVDVRLGTVTVDL